MEKLYDDAAFTTTVESRKQGMAFALKRFHGDVKFAMFEAFTRPNDSLLDLGCGKGQDIAKWIHAKLRYVLGFDRSSRSIDEANNRFKPKKDDIVIQFEHRSNFGTEAFHNNWVLFDHVSAMFSLHYFFESEAILTQCLENISNNLKAGGIFFGIVPEGKKILALLNQKQSFSSDFLNVESQFNVLEPNCFGSKYLFSMNDTVTEHKSPEFLVFSSTFLAIASKFNLQPIIDYPKNSNLLKLLDPKDQGKFLKHLNPNFGQGKEILATASSIFATFALIKTD